LNKFIAILVEIAETRAQNGELTSAGAGSGVSPGLKGR